MANQVVLISGARRLSSRAARNITDATLLVDGGRSVGNRLMAAELSQEDFS
jgi:hypothetical protein